MLSLGAVACSLLCSIARSVLQGMAVPSMNHPDSTQALRHPWLRLSLIPCKTVEHLCCSQGSRRVLLCVVCCVLCVVFGWCCGECVAGRVEWVVRGGVIVGYFSIGIKKPAEAGFFRCTN